MEISQHNIDLNAMAEEDIFGRCTLRGFIFLMQIEELKLF